MTAETFAHQHGLKTHRDECGDLIIPGYSRYGESQLYFDAGELCLMVLNGRPAQRARWAALGGKLWMGDISRLHDDGTGPRVQDVKITGIPLANARAAIRMARVRPRKVLSEAHREALLRAGAASRFKPHV